MTSHDIFRSLDAAAAPITQPGTEPRRRANRPTMPLEGIDRSQLSHSERQIIAMLEAGLDPLTVCRAIRNGEHLRWKAPAAAQEAAS